MCFCSTDEPPYRCCCCLPVIIPVLVVFLFECLRLYWASITHDIFDIVITCLVILHFLVSFVRCNDLKVRQSLFLTYVVSFGLWLIYFIIWLSTN